MCDAEEADTGVGQAVEEEGAPARKKRRAVRQRSSCARRERPKPRFARRQLPP
jgi:hypothetical protein